MVYKFRVAETAEVQRLKRIIALLKGGHDVPESELIELERADAADTPGGAASPAGRAAVLPDDDHAYDDGPVHRPEPGDDHAA